MKLFALAFASILLALSNIASASPEAREAFVNSLPADAKDIHNRVKLIDLWSNASRKPLGQENDEVQIRVLKLPDGLVISTVRWLSADTALAQCDQNEIRFLAFFYRDDGRWTFVKHYSLGKTKK